jgi:TRAP-type C4-dicarboxylate transport system substrate-binding protein
MLQQGVIDGVFMPMGEQKALRLNEVAPNVTVLPGGMYLGSFSIFVNPDFLDDLDPKDRDAILSVSGEKLSQMAGKAWDGIDAQGYKVAKDAGVNIIEVKETDPMALEFDSMIKGMNEEWIESVADRDIDAKAALDELWSTARDYESGMK